MRNSFSSSRLDRPTLVRRTYWALLGLSACLHFAVLMDYAATKSGTPFLLGFSKSKFALIAVYACFILSHLGLMFASHRLLKSGPVILATVCSLIYASLEGGFRYHGFGLITPAEIYRGGLQWRAPNVEFQWIGHALFRRKEFKIWVRNNSRGYNDLERDCRSEEDETYKVVLLGDSYVEGYQVEQEDHLHRRLEPLLEKARGEDVEVIAVGQGGQGLTWQLQRLPETLACYRPELVISTYGVWYQGREGGLRKLLGLSDKRDDSVQRATVQGRSYYYWLYHNPISYAMIWRNLSNTAGYILIRAANILDRLPRSSTVRAQTPAENEKKLVRRGQDFRLAYREMQRLLEPYQAKLFVAISSGSGGGIPYYRSPTGDPSLWVKWESIAERALQEMEIPYVNLSKRFAELGYSKDTLNYKFDGHWRAEGHLRGAEEIALSLRKMHVPQDW